MVAVVDVTAIDPVPTAPYLSIGRLTRSLRTGDAIERECEIGSACNQPLLAASNL